MYICELQRDTNLKYSQISLPCFHHVDRVRSCGLITLDLYALLGGLLHKQLQKYKQQN